MKIDKRDWGAIFVPVKKDLAVSRLLKVASSRIIELEFNWRKDHG
jgi:hypothetical protein